MSASPSRSLRVSRSGLHAVGGGTPGERSTAWPLVVIGVALVSGQLWGGVYTLSIWGPAALVIAACLVALLVSRPMRPSRNALIVLLALLGLAGLSAISMLWAESAPQASLEAHRWALYGGLLAMLLTLLRDQGQRRALMIGIGVAGAVVAAGMALILAFGDASQLFFAMRLTEPLGYVNGQAAALAAVLWPALALAEHGRRADLRGAAAGVACLVSGLLLLVQSRGALLALIAALVFVFAVIPGRIRRGWLLVFIAAGVAAAAEPLLGVYSSTASVLNRPADDVVHDAVRMLLVCAALCGVAWGVATRLLEHQRAQLPLLARIGRWALVALAVVAVAGGLAVVGDPVAKARTQIEQFKALETGGLAQSRLLAGGGNRYDYWRVAVDEWQEDPVLGVGAGNYPRDYFRLRRTPEDIRQPHSLQLQGLSELGVVGFALVMMLLGGLLWACVTAARGVRDGRFHPALVVAASGLIVSWIVHTSVDWLHLLPSLTGVMLCAFAALTTSHGPASGVTRRLPVTVVAVAVTVLAAAGIGRLTLADKLRDDAGSALASDPVESIRLSGRALRLQGDDVQTLYIRAAAFARQNDYVNARRALLDATIAEPHNFVPRALLGDLALRRGERGVALSNYRAAIRLNPLNASLRQTYAQALASDAR